MKNALQAALWAILYALVLSGVFSLDGWPHFANHHRLEVIMLLGVVAFASHWAGARTATR